MSVSIFDNELTETERKVKDKCIEFDEKIANTRSFLDRMKLAQQKMQEIRTILQSNVHGDGLRDASGRETPAMIIPDYDDFRKAIKTRIIRRFLKDARPLSVDFAKSPTSGRNNKGRLSTYKEISVNSNQRKKSRKETVQSNRPSAFGRTSKLAKEDQKKRNSALIETLGKKIYAGQNKSKFGDYLAVPDAAAAPRDSIDLGSEARQRPSTLNQMRESLFKFDAAFIPSDVLTEEPLLLNDALSDLSDYDAEVELLQDEEEVTSSQQLQVLQVQLLQLDNRFLLNSGSYGLNVVNAFDDRQAKGNRFAQRVKLQEGYNCESIPTFFAVGSKLVEEKPYYSERDASHLFFKLEQPVQSPARLSIHKLMRNVNEVVDFSKDQEIKQIVSSSLSCCYSSADQPDIRFAVHLNNNEVSAYKPQQDYVMNHFRVQEQLQVRATGPNEISVKTTDASVLLAYEFTKQLSAIPLDQGLELYFNNIDGLRVEAVLPAGFTEEQFEAFKPQGKYWDIECLNRELNDHAIYKYSLLSDHKDIDKTDDERLNKLFNECIEKQKQLMRLLKFKREYLLRIAKREKPAILKLSMVRNYESFGLKKKVSELLVFLAEPHLLKPFEDGAAKDAQSLLRDKIKSSFLLPKSSFVFGRSLQRKVSKLRNEFERSCLLFSIDIDFDIELCYSKATSAFFIRIHQETPEVLEGGKLSEKLADLSKQNFTGLFGETRADCRLEEPKEGLWLLLPKNSESVLPNNALLQYDTTVARLSVQQARLM